MAHHKKQSEDRLSAEESAILRAIKQQQPTINQIFKDMNITNQEIKGALSQNQNEQSHAKQQDNYLSKYNKYSIQTVKNNYKNAFTGLKWLQLPFCKRLIIDECKFSLLANTILTYTLIKWSQNTKYRIQMNMKSGFKIYGILSCASFALIFAHNLIFQPYCNIDSYHYDVRLSNIDLARKLKSQYDYKPINFNLQQQ